LAADANCANFVPMYAHPVLRRMRSTKAVQARIRTLAALVLHAHGEPQETKGLSPSPLESQLLARPPAAWSEQEVIDATWRGEALGTLLWAATLLDELPSYDRPFDHVSIARDVRFADAELREREELEAARETARLWHWRARTAIVQQDRLAALSSRWTSFDQLIAATAMKGHDRGLLPTPLRGDFPAVGKPYRGLSDEERALAYSIASERHYALEWLCRPGVDWDLTPTDS
jgi:hypothetical protein